MVRTAFPVKVIVSLVIAFAAVGGVVAAGAALRDRGTSQSEPVAATGPTTTTSTLPPTTTTTLPVLQQPPFAVLPTVPLFGWGREAPANPDIKAYEQRLADLHFDPGPIDGLFDQDTAYAMQAVEKIGGLPRLGRINPVEARYLETFHYPAPLHPTAEGNRTEINVTNQTITLYENYQVRLITTTSTASGVTFCYNTPRRAPTAHVCEVATTPNGRYAYYLFRAGNDRGDLGTLFNPYYFFKGRAIHGYAEVPPEPASHGCARIPMHIAEYWHTLVHDGDAVYVDGGADGEHIISSRPI
jgi:peptidoglycan hydrolase-like protein with peptidoglycan-binding domain